PNISQMRSGPVNRRKTAPAAATTSSPTSSPTSSQYKNAINTIPHCCAHHPDAGYGPHPTSGNRGLSPARSRGGSDEEEDEEQGKNAERNQDRPEFGLLNYWWRGRVWRVRNSYVSAAIADGALDRLDGRLVVLRNDYVIYARPLTM